MCAASGPWKGIEPLHIRAYCTIYEWNVPSYDGQVLLFKDSLKDIKPTSIFSQGPSMTS